MSVVLVHTDDLHFLAWKKLADNLGIPFDRTINNRLRGVSRMDSLEIILEKSAVQYTQEQKIAFAEEKKRNVQNVVGKNVPCRRVKRGVANPFRTKNARLETGSW